MTYTYDAWARLKTAQTSGSTQYPQWGLSWDYDRYGNRKAQNVTLGSGPSNAVTPSGGWRTLGSGAHWPLNLRVPHSCRRFLSGRVGGPFPFIA